MESTWNLHSSDFDLRHLQAGTGPATCCQRCKLSAAAEQMGSAASCPAQVIRQIGQVSHPVVRLDLKKQ